MTKPGRKPTPPPRVVVEYDTSPEAEAAYVGAVGKLMDWTVERQQRQQDDVEIVSHYADEDGPECVQALLLLADLPSKPTKQQ